MDLKDTMFAIAGAGLSIAGSKTEDTLRVFPADKLRPELAEAIREHKAEIIRVVREDEEDRLLRETGIIQSERQVFDMAREFFGLNRERGAA